jgi:hypothetical protein
MDGGFGGNDDVTGGDCLFCPNFIEVVLPSAREDGPGVLASWMDVRGDGLAGFEVAWVVSVMTERMGSLVLGWRWWALE